MTKKRRAIPRTSADAAVGADATASYASPLVSSSPLPLAHDDASAFGVAANAADGPCDPVESASDLMTDKSKRRQASTLRSLADHYDALGYECRHLAQRLDLLLWVLDSVAVILTGGIILELSLATEVGSRFRDLYQRRQS
ncbi:hypothetical protein ATCC90586_002437 [Pythium insidiosum]|nr:hypothetical protein ATCC90586_002437 [Pythium insidiosum]